MSNPAERASIPGGSVERSAEFSALTPRHTAMHACVYTPPQPAELCLFIQCKSECGRLELNKDTKKFSNTSS